MAHVTQSLPNCSGSATQTHHRAKPLKSCNCPALSGSPKNRAAGVVPSRARQSKLCRTVHTFYRRFGTPR